MASDDLTPTEKETPWDLVLKEVRTVGADAAAAKKAARDTYDLQIQLNQRFNTLELRVRTLELTRLWLPVAAIVIALIALFR